MDKITEAIDVCTNPTRRSEIPVDNPIGYQEEIFQAASVEDESAISTARAPVLSPTPQDVRSYIRHTREKTLKSVNTNYFDFWNFQVPRVIAVGILIGLTIELAPIKMFIALSSVAVLLWITRIRRTNSATID